MKRLFLLYGCLFLWASLVFSFPVGNPSAPNLIQEGFFISPASIVNFRIGYEGNFVSDRRLKQYSEGFGHVDNFKIDGNFATCTLNFQGRLDVYGVLGQNRLRSDWRIEYPANTFSQIAFETKYQFAWSVGSKILLCEWGPASLSIGGRYGKTKPPIAWITKDGAPLSIEQPRCKLEEWQVDLGLSYHIDLFVPYIAAIYSQARSRLSPIDSEAISNSGKNYLHMKSRDEMGMAVGCALSSIKRFMINIEARMFSEEGVTVTGELRF